jgi:hypothetical protein
MTDNLEEKDMMPVERELVEIMDTQVISYAFKGSRIHINQKAISSITAIEFLEAQEQPTRALYHIPISSYESIAKGGLGYGNSLPRKRKSPVPKHRTDQLQFDLGAHHPTLIYFNNVSLAKAINERRISTFRHSISFLEKDNQKKLNDRYSFLLDQRLTCYPVSRKAAQDALGLLEEFELRYNPKHDFRNTFNDLLIFSTANSLSAPLLTTDRVLSSFVTKYLGINSQIRGEFLEIRFQDSEIEPKNRHRELKGYVNTSWRISFRNYRGAP